MRRLDPEVKFSSGLPPLHLSSTDLQELEDILLRNTDTPELDIEVHSGGFSRRYNRVDELLDDPRLSDFLKSFEMDLWDGENRITFTCNSSPYQSRVSIRGNSEWVDNKKAEISTFVDRNERKIEDVVRNSKLSIGSNLIIYPILYLGYGYIFYEISEGAVGIAVLASMVASLITMFVLWGRTDRWKEEYFPYMLVNLRGKQYHSTSRKAAAVLTMIASIVTIIAFFFQVIYPLFP